MGMSSPFVAISGRITPVDREIHSTRLVETKTFCHASLNSDLSIHLHWESERPEWNGSPLGLHLARALKEFGLIDHSVWVEKEK